jgi:hypothetical protein
MLKAVIMTSPPADREPSTPGTAGPRSRPPVTLRVGRIAVVFTWHGDRWGHVIEVDGRPIASSLEDVADGRDGAWPASPPLVEVATAEAAGGPAVLAVGLAGRSHYSASVARHPTEPDAVLFEIACRIKERAAWLGSTYDMGGTAVRVAAPCLATGYPATVRWSYVAGPDGIRPVPPATPSPSR